MKKEREDYIPETRSHAPLKRAKALGNRDSEKGREI